MHTEKASERPAVAELMQIALPDALTSSSPRAPRSTWTRKSCAAMRVPIRLGQWLVIALAVFFLGLFIVLPLICVFTQLSPKASPPISLRSPIPTRFLRSA